MRWQACFPVVRLVPGGSRQFGPGRLRVRIERGLPVPGLQRLLVLVEPFKLQQRILGRSMHKHPRG